jgi:hypothetical protein
VIGYEQLKHKAFTTIVHKFFLLYVVPLIITGNKMNYSIPLCVLKLGLQRTGLQHFVTVLSRSLAGQYKNICPKKKNSLSMGDAVIDVWTTEM